MAKKVSVGDRLDVVNQKLKAAGGQTRMEKLKAAQKKMVTPKKACKK
jgi:hypothetical protein